jgi:DNA invertase Pin-like site-specific DNA recombinase/prefoldin subunit 5
MGLEQDFNSLDSQREACLAYIQQQPGWILVEKSYEDGGFTGANIERPGFTRLLHDVDAGQIDVIVVYKIDRLSRSLLDFAKVIERLAAVGSSFVSVTQNFSTADAVGRLTMNLLMTFAEFERSLISERTRDKIIGARRRGKWTGGTVPFGYVAKDKKLVVHETEAHVVREAYTLFLQHRQVAAVARLLNAKGLEARTSTRGSHRGNQWTAAAVDRLLRNPTYAGFAKCQDRLYAAEYAGLVEEASYRAAQQILGAPRRSLAASDQEVSPRGGRTTSINPAYVLRGLLRCGLCNRAMCPASTKRGERTHRYYRCTTREKHGPEICAARPLPAGAIEDLVAERLAGAVADPSFVKEIDQAFRVRIEDRRQTLAKLRAALPEQIAQASRSLSKLADDVSQLEGAAREVLGGKLQEEAERLAASERHLAHLDQELAGLQAAAGEVQWMLDTLRDFPIVWEAMTLENRGRLLRALVTQVRVNEEAGVVEMELMNEAAGNAIEEAA